VPSLRKEHRPAPCGVAGPDGRGLNDEQHPAQKYEPEDDRRKPRDGAGSLLGGYELDDVARRMWGEVAIDVPG